jgi:hypothetical protein
MKHGEGMSQPNATQQMKPFYVMNTWLSNLDEYVSKIYRYQTNVGIKHLETSLNNIAREWERKERKGERKEGRKEVRKAVR